MKPYYEDDAVTIYHGDCRDLTDVAVDTVLTDPPYAVRYLPSVVCSNCGNVEALPGRWVCSDCLTDDAPPRPEFEMLGFLSANWEEAETHSRGYADHDPTAYRDLIAAAFTAAMSGLRPGGLVAAFGGTRTYHQLVTCLEALGLEVVDLIAWVHDSAAFARAPSMLRNQLEPCALARKAGPKIPITGDNVVRFPRSTGDRSGHPTPKPRNLMQSLVSQLTQPGETIYNPFMGGGSTLVAAKDLGRKAVGVEVDERYCEIAAKRCAQEVLDFG